MKRLILTFLITITFLYAHAQNGLHGYIASYTNQAPSSYGEGFGFYSAIWPLIPEPVHWFQIGLPSTWISPDNTDNTDQPLCPVGTLARDNWPERGPTYSSVFQTVEGGPGYWAGNKFHYGPPKFKMNATPDCYNNQISTPGWQFFFSDEPLAEDVLGIAQISNCILIPPDGMTFAGNPMGEFLGITYLALPLTSSYIDGHPVGERSWTLFLNAENFKGPLAYYLPETWAKISADYPFDHGRGLDSRPSVKSMAGGTMEFNTVPLMSALDHRGDRYYKIPRLQFPVDSLGRSILAKDVTFYSKNALFNAVLDWRNGGEAPGGLFNRRGMYQPTIRTYPVHYKQSGREVKGINELAQPEVFPGNDFGLKWSDRSDTGIHSFPEYFKDSAEFRIAVPEELVPESTGLPNKEFQKPNPNPSPYLAELSGAWRFPGPVAGPFYATLRDSSMVTYFWYRFIDQPVFQQYSWSNEKKDSLQNLVEAMHQNWTKDKNYMREISSGDLVAFDQALFVNPPAEYAIGYVPIVVRQEKTVLSGEDKPLLPDYPMMELYPNPVSERLRVSLLTQPDPGSMIQVLDVHGRVVYSEEIMTIQKDITVQGLNTGMYFLHYRNGAVLKSVSFLKID